MKNMNVCVEEILADIGVEFAAVPKKERWRIQKAWLDTYARKVKATTGKYVFRGYMWHGFSMGFEKCLRGEKAKQAYFAQQPAGYYIFGEGENVCFACQSDQVPDLLYCYEDVYVVHQDMEWTMAFTHEPHEGPFFARRDDLNIVDKLSIT